MLTLRSPHDKPIWHFSPIFLHNYESFSDTVFLNLAKIMNRFHSMCVHVSQPIYAVHPSLWNAQRMIRIDNRSVSLVE